MGPLDGIRGLAALWVLAAHTVHHCRANIPILSEPRYAVDVFMLVSGFLMTHHSIKRQLVEPMERPRTWLVFWVRRYFRIAPAFYVILIPALLLQGWYFQWADQIQAAMGGLPHAPLTTPLWMNGLLRFTFLFGFFPRYSQTLPIPDWSIALEMQFYLAFPFIVLLYRRLGNLSATLLLTFVWALGHGLIRVGLKRAGIAYDTIALNSILPHNLLPFLVGIVLCRAFAAPRAGSERIFLTLGALLLARLAGAGFFLPLTMLIALLLIVGDAPGERFAGIGPIRAARAALASRPCALLADLSYGIYLVHPMILGPLMTWFIGQPFFMQANPLLRVPMLLALALPAVFAIAWVLHYQVERPGIQLGKRVVDRILGRRARNAKPAPEAALVAP